MAERKIISAAIAPEIDERIVKLAEKLGLTKSNLIANMLESFLPTAEELTQEDILNEDPDLQPVREPIAEERKARSKAADNAAENSEPQYAEEAEDEEEDEDSAGDEDEDEEEEVIDDEEAEAAPPVKRKRPTLPGLTINGDVTIKPRSKSKPKAKKGKK